MWTLFVSLSLVPVLVLLSSSRYRVSLTALCRRVLHRLLKLARRNVCVRSTHSFVFSNCTHGKPDSVMETFGLYAETHPSLSLSPQEAEDLDEVVRRVAPRCVLELGTHCGYASIRILRLLPPGGRLLTVEQDAQSAELAEELIMVAGFKHTQFQVLTQPSAEAIPALSSHLGPEARLDLVLMDHDPQRYLSDLLLLQRHDLLSLGCVLLFCHPQGPHSLSPQGPHSLSPQGPHSLSPQGPHSLSPLGPHSLSPQGPHSLSPQGPHSLSPQGPHSLSPLREHLRAPAHSVRSRAPGLLELHSHTDRRDGREGS